MGCSSTSKLVTTQETTPTITHTHCNPHNNVCIIPTLYVAYCPRDVLEGMANEEAIAARRVVKGLKLSKDELGQALLPEVRQAGRQAAWLVYR